MGYQVLFTAAASEMIRRMIRSVSDRRVRNQLIKRAEELGEEPDKQGRPLLGELIGYRAVRAVGQRYRIVYQVEGEQVRVIIIAAGLKREDDRRDVYALAQRLVRLGLVDPPE